MQRTPDPSDHPRQGLNPLQASRQENEQLRLQVQDLQSQIAILAARNRLLEERHIKDLAEYHSQLQAKDGENEVQEEMIRQQEVEINRLRNNDRQQRLEHKTELDRFISSCNVTAAKSTRKYIREIERLERRHAEEEDRLEARIRRGIAANKGRDWDKAILETMWYDDLRREGRNNICPTTYKAIWEKSHRQCNMSYIFLHPDLKLFKGPSNCIRRCPRAQLAPEQPFNFAGLPHNVKAEIFRIWLQKDDIIHCISRLSSYPGQTPMEPGNSSRLPHVFFWKPPPQRCAIHLAHQPADVLKHLLVCREWLHIGATCFYSMNTFAFSSLGEFGRFFKGIGLARRQLVQSIELMHIGSQMKKDGTDNPRTRPLQLIPSMVRISHITLYLDEGWKYRRRPYEEMEVQQILIDATKFQENKRPRRSIRTIHGMDYYYSMRGIEQFEVYDTSKLGRKQPITDQSALDDIHNQVKTPKFRCEEHKAKLENLEPLLTPTRGWAPSHAIRTTCRHFFNPPPNVYRKPLRPRPMGGGGNGDEDPQNHSPNDDGNDDSNDDYPRDDDSRGRREDSGYHSSAAQPHDRDSRQVHGNYVASGYDSGHDSDDTGDNDDYPGRRSGLPCQRLQSVFSDTRINNNQSRVLGNSIFIDSESTSNRSQLQGNLRHGQSDTPIIIADNEDDNDRPRFRGTLRQDRSATPMFVSDDGNDEDYSVDDNSLLNFQSDRFGVLRPALSELQSSIEFDDDEREVNKEYFSDNEMCDNQIIEVNSRASSPDLDDFVIKEEMSTVDNPILIDDDDEQVIKEESVDENDNFGGLHADSMESDDAVIVLSSRKASPDLDKFVIKVEAATLDDPIILDDDDEDSGEIKQESNNIDGNSSTIKSAGSSFAMAICVDGEEDEGEVDIKSEVTSPVTDDMRAFSMRNICLSAGQDSHDPVNLTLDPPLHDTESHTLEMMGTSDTSSSVSIQPHDSASNIAATIAGSILYSAPVAPIVTHNYSSQELFEVSEESSEVGHATKRTALAHHDGDRRASKRQRSEGSLEFS